MKKIFIVVVIFLCTLTTSAMNRYSSGNTKSTRALIITELREQFSQAYDRPAKTPQENASKIEKMEDIAKRLMALGACPYSDFVNKID